MLGLLKRTIKIGWVNFHRNLGLSIATCFIIAMTVFLIVSLLLLRDVTKDLLEGLEKKVDISVYFKEVTLEEDILKLKEEIIKLPEVREVEYISRAQALERFIERYQGNAIVMESLLEVGNPLLPALNITAWQASQYQALTNYLENFPQKDLIHKVDYFERKPVIERINSIVSTLNTAGVVLFLILAVIAILVAFNQIKLAIYSSREEIGIQRLVGASNWFIRGPFLVQGAISGIFAALGTLIIFIITLAFLSPKFVILSPELNLLRVFWGKFWLFFLIHLFAGISLGVVSSIIAIRKYLKV
ncbi:MAG: permease-like cell division protein FtsX [Patescibacteria group bacterium]